MSLPDGGTVRARGWPGPSWRSPLALRIAFGVTLPVLLAAATLGVLLSDRTANAAQTQLEARLGDQARAVAHDAAPLLAARAPLTGTIDLAVTYGGLFGNRVTIVYPDGTVTGDSLQAAGQMGPQDSLPEIRAALAQPEVPALVVRPNPLDGRSWLYVALGVLNPAPPYPVVGVVRVGGPLTAVDAARMAVWETAALVALVALAAGALLAMLLARSVLNPLAALQTAMRRFGGGDLSARVPVTRTDEIGDLDRAFNTLAQSLAGTLAERTAQRDQLAAVLAYMRDGIVLTDAQGEVRSVNAAALDLFHLTLDRVHHRSLIEITHSHELHRALRAALRSPGEHQQVEVTVERAQIVGVVTAVPGMDGTGPTGLVVLQDVSELRRLERVRRDFVANIGHELRTPLASVKLLVETLLDSGMEDPTAAATFLQRIDVEVDGLTQLVRELLELSRIESGQVVLKRTNVEVPGLLEGAVARLRAQAERAGLALSVQPAADLPRVYADEARVEQVLVNLIHNAVKFTPRGGTIRVGAERDGARIRISVADTGIGIPAEDLPRIFERFYKVDKARAGPRDREGGTGLGLAIAKHIVQAHGGQIWAQSPSRQGTTFYFTLPSVHGG